MYSISGFVYWRSGENWFRYDTRKKAFEQIKYEQGLGSIRLIVPSARYDWIFTRLTIYRYDRMEQSYEIVSIDERIFPLFDEFKITCAEVFSDNKLLFGTQNKGAYMIEAKE